MLGVLGLCACSLLTIAAATEDDVDGDPNFFLKRQIAFFAVGATVALVMSRVDYSRVRALKWGLYGFIMVSILAVLALGSETRGSRRAIQTPFFEVQTSELAKVLLVVFLAAFLIDRARGLHNRDTTARAMLLGLVPSAIVMAEDLGSGLVLVAITFAVLFVAGTPTRHLLALVALGATAITIVLVAAPAVGVDVLKPYQEQRLTSFLHPSDDPSDAGYQQNQSRIAIGSGEKTGRGDAATQTKLNFLPEHHTDFVFAVVGERWGFVGGALVLSLYALLIWRGLRILTMAKNLFGALIAGGIVAMLLFQVFVNVGMNVGIMPITGIPLPLMSYGGSSVLSTFLAIGLLQSIYVQGRTAAATKGRILAA
jgi:rod shape determining protein RodA